MAKNNKTKVVILKVHKDELLTATELNQKMEKRRYEQFISQMELMSEYKDIVKSVIVKYYDDFMHYYYNAPCPGCPEGHASMWKSLVESPQWLQWEKVANKRGWDVDESRECGIMSNGHLQDFLLFCAVKEKRGKDIKGNSGLMVSHGGITHAIGADCELCAKVDKEFAEFLTSKDSFAQEVLEKRDEMIREEMRDKIKSHSICMVCGKDKEADPLTDMCAECWED